MSSSPSSAAAGRGPPRRAGSVWPSQLDHGEGDWPVLRADGARRSRARRRGRPGRSRARRRPSSSYRLVSPVATSPPPALDEPPHGLALRVRHRREVRQDEDVQLRRVARDVVGVDRSPRHAGGATSASTAPANGAPSPSPRPRGRTSRCSSPTTRRRPSRSAGGRRGTPRSSACHCDSRSAVRSWRRSSWLRAEVVPPRLDARRPSLDRPQPRLRLGLGGLAEHRPRRPEVEGRGSRATSLSQPRTPWTIVARDARSPGSPRPAGAICQSSMTIARARPDRASGGGSPRTSRRGRPGTCRASRSRARPPRASRGCTRPRSPCAARSSSGSTRGTRRRPSPRAPGRSIGAAPAERGPAVVAVADLPLAEAAPAVVGEAVRPVALGDLAQDRGDALVHPRAVDAHGVEVAGPGTARPSRRGRTSPGARGRHPRTCASSPCARGRSGPAARAAPRISPKRSRSPRARARWCHSKRDG